MSAIMNAQCIASRGFILLIGLVSVSASAQTSNVADQNLLSALAGYWHSVGGYVSNVSDSTCYTTQSFSWVTAGADSANFTYSFSCSTGYQGQSQALDFNPDNGTYQNGYNSVSSEFLVNSSNIVDGIQREQTTTWGFGSMVNYQYQTVRIVGPSSSGPNGQQTLSFDLTNSQSNVNGGQGTTYHLDLVRDSSAR